MVNKKSIHSKRLSERLIALVVLLLVVAALIYHLEHKTSSAVAIRTSSSSSSKYPPPAVADNNANDVRKSSSSPASTLDNGSTSSPTNNSGTYTVQINPVVSNDNVHVGTLVNGTTSGNCSLTATKASQTTQQLGTSTVKLDINNYDCGVFNIPTSNFPGNGTWELTLTVTNNGESVSGSASVTI